MWISKDTKEKVNLTDKIVTLLFQQYLQSFFLTFIAFFDITVYYMAAFHQIPNKLQRPEAEI